MTEESKPQETINAPPQIPIVELPAGGGVLTPTNGGSMAAGGGFAARLPTGGITLDVGDDTEEQLKKGAPAFGNVLAAIGSAIADSQKALDQSVVDTINKLNDTKIEVVNQVVIELDDNGVPYGDEQHTTLVKNTVSVLNYYTPVFHAWKEVRISMDLAVGAFHQQQGFQFSQKQSNTSLAGGFSWTGAFGGWFSGSHSSSQVSVQSSSQTDVAWSSGQLLVDAELGSRSVVKFPPAAEIPVGPQILVLQGKIAEQKTGQVVTRRTVDLAIQVRKVNGEPNPGVAIIVEAPGLAGGGGKTTEADGKITFQLMRDLPAGVTGFRQFPLSINLGDIKKPYTLTL
jgi:hypothetical protein